MKRRSTIKSTLLGGRLIALRGEPIRSEATRDRADQVDSQGEADKIVDEIDPGSGQAKVPTARKSRMAMVPNQMKV